MIPYTPAIENNKMIKNETSSFNFAEKMDVLTSWKGQDQISCTRYIYVVFYYALLMFPPV